MIPSSNIQFNDDGTAWWIPPDFGDGIPAMFTHLDRPCEAECFKGTATYENYIVLGSPPCPDCSGTGRHTFDIEAPCQDEGCSGTSLYRASVVPGMVLPIERMVSVWSQGDYFVSDLSDDNGLFGPLPPAAAPGMWAVKLKVVT